MAKIRDSAATISASATSIGCNMPIHQTGDLLIAFVSKDGTPVVNTPANWSATAAVGASVGAYGGIWTRRAQSAAETVTFTTGTAGAWAVAIVSVQDAFGTATNGSDALSVAAVIGATDSTSPYTGTAITPAHENCLIFSGVFTDATFALQSDPGWVHVFTGDSGSNSIAVAYTVEDQASVAVNTPNWRPGTGVDDDTRVMMLAIRDSGTLNTLECYVDKTAPPSYLLANLTGTASGDVNSVAYIPANQTTLSAIQIAGLNNRTSSGVAVTAVTDSGYNPYRSTAQTPGFQSTTNLGHSEITCTFNMTQGDGLFFGMYRLVNARDYLDLGTTSQGGVFINFTNGSNANARAWQVGSQGSETTKIFDFNPFVIQPQQITNTAYGWNGTVTWSSVSRVSFGSSSWYGAVGAQWCNFYMLADIILLGGTAANPFTVKDAVRVANQGSGYIPVTSLSGSTMTSFAPLQFGGVDRCNVSFDLATVQFPTKTDKLDYLDFHVDDNKVGVEFYGVSANDSFSFKNAVFTSQSPYYWRFNANSSALASYDFSGCSVINSGIVTLRPVTTFNNMSFVDCRNITQNSAVVTNSTFDGSSIKVDSLANISNSDFISNGITVEAQGAVAGIELTPAIAAGSHNLVNCTFTGYGGSLANRAIYNNSGKAITINVIGGDIPDIRNGAGASTTVVVSYGITLTGLKANSEVRVYIGTDPNTATEIAGVENSGTTFTFAHEFPGEQGYIQVINFDYQAFNLPITFTTEISREIPITQVTDRVASNP